MPNKVFSENPLIEHETGEFREPADKNVCATSRNLAFYARGGEATVIADETVADSAGHFFGDLARVRRNEPGGTH